jgi:hypothetical protein
MTIVIKLAGGVGNQLFQYCLGRRLADKNNDRLLLDASYYQKAKHCKYELDRFNIRVDNPTPEDNTRQYQLVQENTMSFIPEVLELKGDIILQGYWQNPKYIEQYLVEELSFTKGNVSISNRLGIHVRGNDYKGWKKFDVCTYEYYNKAFKKVKKYIDGYTHIEVFTDDIPYARYLLWDIAQEANLTYLDIPDTVEAMKQLAWCNQKICSNSTFAWWACTLGVSGMFYFPSKWFNDVGDGQHEQINLCKPNMILIDP